MSQDFLVGKVDAAKKAYFLGGINEPKKEAAEVSEADSDKKLSKSAKIMIGATALATAVVAGIAIAKNIQKGKVKAEAEAIAEAIAKAEAEARAKAEAEAQELRLLKKARVQRREEQAMQKAARHSGGHVTYYDAAKERYISLTPQEASRFEQEAAKQHAQAAEYVANLKQTLRSKTPVNSETIDARLKPEIKEGAWAKEDMKAYYESDCAKVEKSNLYTSYKNFSADGKLVKEKRIYTASSEYGEGTTETICINKNGTRVSEIKTPDGELIQTRVYKPCGNSDVIQYFENGKLSKIVSKDKTGKTETIFADGVKTSMHKNKDGTQVFKIYEQDKNGKYHCISRRTDNHRMSEDFEFDTKTVDYINNREYSRTQTYYNVEDNLNGNIKFECPNKESIPYSNSNRIFEIRSTVIRDKKGNIIDESKIKTPKSRKPKSPKGTVGTKGTEGAQDTNVLLASWYKDYLKLCEKYDVTPRACGVKGGAGDHYFELCLRRNDPQAYERYLRIQEYRAKYDEKGMILEILRIADEESVKLSPEKLSKLSKDEIKSLLNAIGEGDLEVKELEKLSPIKIKEKLNKIEENKFSYIKDDLDEESVIRRSKEIEEDLEDEIEEEIEVYA